MPRIAWIGLGNMGRGMSYNLATKGDLDGPLLLYNRTQARADEHASKFEEGQVKVVSSIAEAVEGADIVYTIVSNDAAVKETYEEILKHEVGGKLFVDCSTVDPETVDEVVGRVEGKGAGFVASQVFGVPAVAEAGQLLIILAGKASLVEKLEPYAKGVMGKGVLKFADEAPSKGPLMKLTGNTFIMNMVEAVAQGLVMGEVTGLGVDHVRDFLLQFYGTVYSNYADRMISGAYFKKPPLMSVDNANKDSSHAKRLAGKEGVTLPGIEIALKHFDQIKQVQGAEGDLASLYGANRKENGLPYHNDGRKE